MDLSAFYHDAKRPVIGAEGMPAPPTSARDIAEAQQRAASLATRVADEYPDHFSLLVHHPDGTATVHLTGEVPESLIQEFADENVSVVGDAAFSEREAQAVTAKVHSRLIDGLGSTDLLTSVDNLTGEISVVTKSARDAAEAVRFLEPLAAELDGSSVSRAADRVVISTDPSLQFELER